VKLSVSNVTLNSVYIRYMLLLYDMKRGTADVLQLSATIERW